MDGLSQHDLWELRGMIQQIGWEKFMSHVGSLMAEQADKVERDSKQDKSLFSASCLIHQNLSPLWKDCGFFDYRKFKEWGFLPEAHVAQIEGRSFPTRDTDNAK